MRRSSPPPLLERKASRQRADGSFGRASFLPFLPPITWLVAGAAAAALSQRAERCGARGVAGCTRKTTRGPSPWSEVGALRGGAPLAVRPSVTPALRAPDKFIGAGKKVGGRGLSAAEAARIQSSGPLRTSVRFSALHGFRFSSSDHSY